MWKNHAEKCCFLVTTKTTFPFTSWRALLLRLTFIKTPYSWILQTNCFETFSQTSSYKIIFPTNLQDNIHTQVQSIMGVPSCKFLDYFQHVFIFSKHLVSTILLAVSQNKIKLMFLTGSSFKKVIQPVVSWKTKIFTGIMNTSIEIKYNFFGYLKKLQLLWKKTSIIKTYEFTQYLVHIVPVKKSYCEKKACKIWGKRIGNLVPNTFPKRIFLPFRMPKKSLQSSWNRNKIVELIRAILDLLLHFRKTCYSFNDLWYWANIVYYLTRI